MDNNLEQGAAPDEAESTLDVAEREPETEERAEDAAKDEGHAAIEAEARSLGWKSREEWSGRVPPHFQDDPEAFLRERKSLLSEKAQRQLEELARENETLKGDLTEVKTFFQQYKRDKERQLEAALKRAIDDGDHDAAQAVLKERDELREEAKKPNPQAPQPAADPDFMDWHRDNGWYNRDEALTAEANAQARALHAMGISEQTHGRQFYDMVTERVGKLYPERLNPGQKMTQPNRQAEAAPAQRKKSAWSRVPKDAQDAFLKSAAYRQKIFGDDPDKARESWASEFIANYGEA